MGLGPYKNEKQNMIAKRERYRTLLQIKNLATCMKVLKEDLDKDKGVGLSLPAVENIAGKLETAARAYQTARFTDEGWNVDKADEGLNKRELHDQIMMIKEELEDRPVGYYKKLEDREPGDDLEQGMIDDGILTDPEKDIDQETEEIKKIEVELKGEEDTRTW